MEHHSHPHGHMSSLERTVEHEDPHLHHHHEPETHETSVTWRQAGSATLHCLTGCAIGEVLGMVIGTSLGFPHWGTIALAVTLAFLFGYAFTMRPLLKTGLAFGTALSVALAADTISIAVMEIVDNAIMLFIPGAMESGVTSFVFWGSLAFALGVAFLVAWPINRYLIGRGLGHAKVHQFHNHH